MQTAMLEHPVEVSSHPPNTRLEVARGGVLVVKGKAGLGNRILCTLSAILYARMSHRKLFVDWTDFAYSNAGENAFSRLFVSPDIDPSLAVLETDSIRPEIWRGRMKNSANELMDQFDPDKHRSATIYRKYSAEMSSLDHPEQILVMWNFGHQIRALRPHFVGDFAQYAALGDRQILKKLLKENLQPHPEIRAAVEEFATKNFSRPVLGVHVRFMDRRSKIGPFLSTIDRVQAKYGPMPIFLATDNRKAHDIIESKYGQVITREKWFPTGGVSMHQNPECKDRLKNATDAITDMYLLSACNYLIYPGSSTFSQISALSSNMPEDNIFDTERLNVRIRVKRLVRSWIQ